MGPVNQGAESCQAFGGYHNAMTYTDGTTPIVYAILPDCSSGNGHDFENVTVAASHEIVEATTDPGPESTPGWYLDLPECDAGITTNEFRNDPWTRAISARWRTTARASPVDTWELDGGDLVQRIWSPTAAAVGHNPCCPGARGRELLQRVDGQGDLRRERGRYVHGRHLGVLRHGAPGRGLSKLSTTRPPR